MCISAGTAILAGTILASAAASTATAARGQHMQSKASKTAQKRADQARAQAKASMAGQAHQAAIPSTLNGGSTSQMRGIQSTIMASRPTSNKLGA